MGKKAALHNLGCKVNAYETEAMRQLLEEAGYEIVPFAPGADVYVINTCTVTNIADRKSRQMLHRARKMNPEAIVVAAGCYVQTMEEDQTDPVIDLVLGNNHKKDLPEALRQFEKMRSENAGKSAAGSGLADRINDGENTEKNMAGPVLPALEKGDGEKAAISTAPRGQSGACAKELRLVPENARKACVNKTDISRTREYESLSIAKTKEHTRAYMKVQDGCNQFCTYCIIPYARGRVRSRKIQDVLREAQLLAENGCREIVLTGIHLSSYGTDTGTDLAGLIRAVHEVQGISRIRLGSLEPGIITESFAETMASLPKICPHFHLSLQSGCTATLRRMNRRYTAEEYEEKCALLRRVFDRPALTTDVIAGFPQETEEEFEETLRFLERIRLYETHIFKYSRRQGTRAAAMPGQISEQEKTRRSELLIALGEKNRSLYEKESAGRRAEVLFEEKLTAGGVEYYTGYTKEYLRMLIPAGRDYANRILTGSVGRELEPHLFLLDAPRIWD